MKTRIECLNEISDRLCEIIEELQKLEREVEEETVK